MKAALLDNGKVIGEVFDAPTTGFTVELAGAFTNDNQPVNVSTMKISRSKTNLDKAAYCQPVTKIGAVWTFYAVRDGKVVY